VAEATGQTVLGVAADVSDADQVHQLVRTAAERLGGIDVLVTNASGPKPGTFRTLDDATWASAIDLTLMGPVRSLRTALCYLKRSPGASVLALASSSVKAPIPNLTLSNVLRPAVHALVKTLPLELAGDGIRVNCLYSGRVPTPRIDQLDTIRAKREATTVGTLRDASLTAVPLGRLGDVEEFDPVAAFLASDAASCIPGSSILVDGGMARCL